MEVQSDGEEVRVEIEVGMLTEMEFTVAEEGRGGNATTPAGGDPTPEVKDQARSSGAVFSLFFSRVV